MMRGAIPVLVGRGIGQAKVGAEVDDLQPGGGLLGAAARRLTVGQAEKDYIHLIGAGDGVGQCDEWIGPRHRVEITVGFAGARFAGHPAYAHLRVALEQLNQLKTCIAGGAGDAGVKLLAHDHLSFAADRPHALPYVNGSTRRNPAPDFGQ